MFDEHHSAKWTRAQGLEPIEVIQACCALRKHDISPSETFNWQNNATQIHTIQCFDQNSKHWIDRFNPLQIKLRAVDKL